MKKFARNTYTLTAFASLMMGCGMLPAAQALIPEAKTTRPAGAPVKLRVDDLTNPLGLDHASPRFSWVLQDEGRGARQTAYQIEVSTNHDGKADVWASGHVASGQSVGVVYQGPTLTPSTRYYWRVTAWDKDGKPYPVSEAAWWETGLMSQNNWRAKWIGYQSWEESAVRKAGAQWITTPDGTELNAAKGDEQKVAYRLSFKGDKSAQRVYLYMTGQDVASAWVNGVQVATGAPLPGWKQLPWKKYVKIDVTKQLHDGENLLAIETTHYIVNPNGMASKETPAMSATLVTQLADGSVTNVATSVHGAWKTSIHPGNGWTGDSVEDASWKAPVPYVAGQGMDAGLGNPWPAEAVKALRGEFEVRKPVASARLYVTALGAYQAFLNGKRVGDDVLSPGWTDYRLRLKYQTYDVTSQVTQGSNALSALVAPGWYSTPLQWFQQPNIYGVAPPSLRAQLRIQHSDGTVDWVCLLYTSPSPRDRQKSRMPSSA